MGRSYQKLPLGWLQGVFVPWGLLRFIFSESKNI
jgi:hypothetical protein